MSSGYTVQGHWIIAGTQLGGPMDQYVIDSYGPKRNGGVGGVNWQAGYGYSLGVGESSLVASGMIDFGSSPYLLADNSSMGPWNCDTCDNSAFSSALKNSLQKAVTAIIPANKSIDIGGSFAGFYYIGNATEVSIGLATDSNSVPTIGLNSFSAIFGFGMGFAGRAVTDANANIKEKAIFSGNEQAQNTTAVIAKTALEGNLGVANGSLSATAGIQADTVSTGGGNPRVFANTAGELGGATSYGAGGVVYSGVGFSYQGGSR